MSGKLRLNGATSGYSELQAPDVAGDQTFTLPAVGGELVTKQSGGSVVGYQQGLWTPNIRAYTVAANGAAFTTDTEYWSRIGNQVTINTNFVFTAKGTSGSGAIAIYDFPYPVINNPGFGSGFSGAVCFMSNSATPISSVFTRTVPSNDSTWNGGIAFLCGMIGSSSTTYSSYNWQQMVSDTFNFRFSATYLTDDTTFVPINGATIS